MALTFNLFKIVDARTNNLSLNCLNKNLFRFVLANKLMKQFVKKAIFMAR